MTNSKAEYQSTQSKEVLCKQQDPINLEELILVSST